MAFGLSAGAVALIGAGVGAAGSAYASSQQRKAAEAAGAGAAFQPYAVQGIGGSGVGFEFGPDGPKISAQLGGAEQDIRSAALTGAGNELIFGGQNQGLQDTIRRQTAGSIPGLFAEQQGILRNTISADAGLSAAQDFGRMGAQQNAFGLQGLQAAFNGPNAGALTQNSMERGNQLLDTAGGSSFNDLAAQRLTALRDQARPAEQRAVDQKFNNLFASGRLGTEGGARGIEALATSQQQADFGRIINSQDFANSQQNQERAFQQNQQQLGTQLLGQAFAGTGQDQAQAAQLGNLGASQFGAQGQSVQNQLQARQGVDQFNISTGQARLQGAQSLFGFGDAMEQTSLNRAGQQLGLSQSIDQGLLDQARLGASVGQAQSTANANAGQIAMAGHSSPFGSAVAGLGAGIASNAEWIANRGGE